MYGKLQKNIGFSLIIFAFFFLFEPSYGLIDPLPDIVGYIILCVSLSNLADINDRIMSAVKGFRWGIVLSALKVCSLILLEKIFISDEQTVGLLLFVFIFAFFEIAILLPAYKALFEGLLTLGMFNDGDAVYYKKRERGRNRTENIYTLTLVFVIFKNVICTLPDFTTLQTNSSYEFITITRILAIIAVTPLSVVWLISIISYFVKIGRDERFVESLTQKYLEKSQSTPNLYVYRVIGEGLTLIFVALILTFDLYSQNVNYTPDAFFCALMIIAAILLKRYSKKWVPIVIISSVGAISSLFLFAVEKEFFERHYIGAIKRDLEAYRHFYLMLALYVVQALIAIALILTVAWFLYDIFSAHAIKEGGDTNEINAIWRGLRIRLVVFSALAIVSKLMCIYRIWALPYFSRGWFFEYSSIISSTVSVGFIASAFVLISFIRAEIKDNYKLHL